MDMWSALFKSKALPSVRNTKQTCSSIAMAAALFRLMGKVKTMNVSKLLHVVPFGWFKFAYKVYILT